MADIMTKDRRSHIMSLIKSKDTKPELLVRKHLFNKGLRFRLHQKGLPGTPDIVLKKYNSVILVQGCFWHHHYPGCRGGRLPKSNQEYWISKIERNQERDKENIRRLKELGWRVFIIWECELKKAKREQTINTVIEKIKRSTLDLT